MDYGESSYRRFLEGDKDAFDTVLELYFDSLTFFISRFVREVHTAEDLAIDSLLELIVHPRRYNFKTPLKTYLFAIGHNKAVNYVKRASRTELRDLTDADFADAQSLEEEILREDEKRRLNRAVEALPEEMRTAVHLVYFESLTYTETAKVMKKSKKQVDNLLYRAKAILKKELSGKDCDTARNG